MWGHTTRGSARARVFAVHIRSVLRSVGRMADGWEVWIVIVKRVRWRIDSSDENVRELPESDDRRFL